MNVRNISTADLALLNEMDLTLGDVNDHAKDCLQAITLGMPDQPNERSDVTLGMLEYLRLLTLNDESVEGRQLNQALTQYMQAIAPWFTIASAMANSGSDDVAADLSILQLTASTP